MKKFLSIENNLLLQGKAHPFNEKSYVTIKLIKLMKNSI